jgi:hypothetical protein
MQYSVLAHVYCLYNRPTGDREVSNYKILFSSVYGEFRGMLAKIALRESRTFFLPEPASSYRIGDSYRRPSTTACPGCWAIGSQGHVNWNSVRWGKQIFYKADLSSIGRIKISCTGTTSPTNKPRKNPFHLYSICLSCSAVSRGHPSLVFLVRMVTSFSA